MALPTSYLTSTKRLPDILAAIQAAQAPPKFTLAFLENLGFKTSSDRLVVGVLKAMGFLNDASEPQDRYFRFLDQTQGELVLAEGIRDAYADLFQVNNSAQSLSRNEVKNKFKTLSQGQYSDSVLTKMAGTFTALCSLADFSAASKPQPDRPLEPEDAPGNSDGSANESDSPPLRLGGLVYNIQLHLPESRDPAVYAALFKSLKEHLLR